MKIPILPEMAEFNRAVELADTLGCPDTLGLREMVLWLDSRGLWTAKSFLCSAALSIGYLPYPPLPELRPITKPLAKLP